MRLRFGKFKGMRIDHMTSREQTEYLRWLIRTPFISNKLRKAIKERLKDE